ncbi:PGF-CTERM sorting domain-containing protein [Halobacteria archaeon AArc-dxtr1]|nr:PGF-CTERM sorting domain-containing protein [Halobacteria archaeon AArc-dxtr1]
MLLCALAVAVVASSAAIPVMGAVAESDEISEEPFLEPVPDADDDYFEAEASDGSWISYVNPRDEYRSPYLGEGSGKICVTLVNEAGEPVVGESVSETTVTIPTGDSLVWHTGADPLTVQYPLTDHYDRPLDADQFGTTDELPQGDGYLDSHCIEFHGLPEDGEIEYGEVMVDGAHADRIELAGYIQQDDQAWETDVDPIADAVSYEEAGGGWTYSEPESHGQVVAVLQLTADDSDGDSADGADDTGDDADDAASDDATAGPSDDAGDAADGAESDDPENHGDDDRTDSVEQAAGGDDPNDDDTLAGFATVLVLLATAVGAGVWYTTSRE